MGVGAGLYMYVVVVQKFTFAISSPDEFLYDFGLKTRIHAPFWGFWSTFPPKSVTHRRNPKRTVLGRNHVIWAIKHEYRLRGSSWVCEEEKKTVQDRTGKKSQKGYISLIWREVPTEAIYIKNLCSRWPCRRRNHVCQVSKWNFQGLRFCRGSNFPFSYWFLNGPYNSAAQLPVKESWVVTI